MSFPCSKAVTALCEKQNELNKINNMVNDLHIDSLTNIRFSGGFTIKIIC